MSPNGWIQRNKGYSALVLTFTSIVPVADPT